MRVLVTNDDGPKSPLMAPFFAALSASSWCSELRFVLPAEEQSWISQAVSRFRPIYTSAHRIGEQAGFLATGTPADCVGLGLHHLYPEAADLVISGINVGTNAGLPFYLNSGTVGGARQAITFGVRAIALSVLVPGDLFHLWREEDHMAMELHRAHWERIARTCAALSARLASAELWDGVDMYSVNVPWIVDEKTEVVLTELERWSYLPLYVPGDRGSFVHHAQGARRGHMPKEADAWPDDLKTVEEGKVSLQPVRYDLRPSNEEVVGRLRRQFDASGTIPRK